MGDTAERTIYVTGLHADVTDDLLEELFTQIGPIESCVIRNTENGSGKFRYCLCTFEDEESVPFAITTLDEVKLFRQPISVKPKGGSKQDEIYKAAKRARQSAGPSPSSNSHGYSSSSRYDVRDSRKRPAGSHRVREENWRQSHVLPPPPPPPRMPEPMGYPPGPPPFNTITQYSLPRSAPPPPRQIFHSGPDTPNRRYSNVPEGVSSREWALWGAGAVERHAIRDDKKEWNRQRDAHDMREMREGRDRHGGGHRGGGGGYHSRGGRRH